MRGITFIEIIAVMAIMMILLGFASPFVHYFQQEARDKNSATQIMNLMHYATEMALVIHKTIEMCIADSEQCEQKGAGNFLIFTRSYQLNQHIIILKRIALDDDVSIGMRSYSGKKNVTRFYTSGDMLSDNSLYYVCHQHALNPAFAIAIDRMANSHVIKPNHQGEIIDSHQKRVLC